LVRIEAWRTVSPFIHPARLSERCETSFRLDTESVFRPVPQLRPTDFCHLTTYPNRQPAFSVLVSSHGLRRSRDEEPDVSRRPSSLRPDRRFSMGFVAPGLHVPACFEEAKYVSILASDTFVAPPCFSRRPLRRSTSSTPRPRLACCRHPVKDVDRVTSQSAFLRQSLLELSSWSSIPVAHHPESSGEPHQLEWVGPMKHRPVTRSARARTSCDAKSEMATSRSSSRPHEERRPLGEWDASALL